MAKHIGSYSAMHGPAGKVLTDYVEVNIPQLWNRITERITNVANDGSEYTGTIFGWDAENPFRYTPDKFFLFTPHVHNNSNCALSLNGLPLLKILSPLDRGPIPENTMVPGGDYLLWIKQGAFELLLDLSKVNQDTADKVVQLLEHDVSIGAYTGAANIIATAGFANYADAGGKFWKRQGATEPTGTPPLPAFFKRQDFDGRWYEAISRQVVYGEEIGIAGDISGADQTDRINDIVAWLGAKGGGKLILPPGIIHCATSLTINTSGIAIEGTAIGNSANNAGSTLRLAPGAFVAISTNDAERQQVQFSNLSLQQQPGSDSYFFVSRMIRGLLFQNINLKGIYGFHQAGNTGSLTWRVVYQNIGGNLHSEGSQDFLQATNITNFAMTNCVVSGGAPPVDNSNVINVAPGAARRPDNCFITSCAFSNFDSAISVSHGITNFFVTNSSFTGLKRHGVRFIPDDLIEDARFTNCHFQALSPPTTQQFGAILAEAASSGTVSRSSFQSCHFSRFGRQGMNIQDANFDLHVMGCQFEDNCSAQAGESVVHIAPGVQGLTLTNNQIFKKNNAGDFATKPQHGINIASTGTKLNITNNQIDPNDLTGSPINNPNRGPAHLRRIHNNTMQVFEGQVVLVGPWIAVNVNANAGLRMTLANNAGVINTVTQRRGKAVGIACRCSDPVNAANSRVTAGTITFNVMKNDNPFGMTATRTAPSSFGEVFDEDLDGNDFDAGDQLGIRLTTSSDYAPASTLEWAVYISIYYD